MSHLDPETLQRALHGELDADAAARAAAHRAECAGCARRWDEAAEEERRVEALLATLDHDLPRIEPPAERAARPPAAPAWRRAAAGVALLVAAGGLAWALPGSPVRGWVRSAVVDDAAPEPGGGPFDGAAGIAVDPGDSLDVAFDAPQRSGSVRVVFVPSGAVTIRIAGAAPDLRVESHRVRVANAGATADYRIEIPDSAPLVRVTVAGRAVLVKRGSDVGAAVTPDAPGAFTFPVR